MSRVWVKTDLAAFIRSHGDEVLAAWETRVRSEVTAAKAQGVVALRNTLAAFLGDMADALEPAGPAAPKRLSAHGTHGKQRSGVTAYSLPQVMREYSILRVTLLQTIEREADLPTSLRDQLLTSIDAAMCEATSAFADDKKEQERRGRLDAEAERDRVKLAAEVLRGELKAIELASAVLKTDRDALHGEITSVRSERDTSRDRMAELTADASLRERFVATLAHDLRTPLGAIKMAFELLLVELPKRPEVAELSDLLFRNIARTETMLQDLLDTHRIHAGHRLPLHIARCNLSEIARATLKDLAAEFGPRFELEVERDATGFWDAERLRRLLENLLTNAVKYGERNKPISVLLEQNERMTTLKVHNFGKPIPPEDQRTLFEAFYRADTAESSRAKGWGLGLTLVSGVVDGHGGTIKVASSAAGGTTFTVFIPNDSRPLQEVPQ
jgi:signal transduction histidine kinase